MSRTPPASPNIQPEQPRQSETESIRQRYARRTESVDENLYDVLHPYVSMMRQERERAFIRWIHWAKLQPVGDKRVLDVGCGGGGWLSQLMRLGFEPANLTGIDLLEDRISYAETHLPSTVTLLTGDASQLDLDAGSFDVVLHSTLFSSVLDDALQADLAAKMWSLVRPGGGVLWYDFTYNNPRNQDVRGVPLSRIGELFPEASLKAWRITLAPPLGRPLASLHPSLYSLANLLPFLRTHILCWLGRPA